MADILHLERSSGSRGYGGTANVNKLIDTFRIGPQQLSANIANYCIIWKHRKNYLALLLHVFNISDIDRSYGRFR